MTDGADRPPSHERADPSTDRPSAPTSGRLRRTLPEGSSARSIADSITRRLAPDTRLGTAFDRWVIPIALFVVAWIAYAWINHGRTAFLDYFVPLADAFLHGQLGLTESASYLNELVPSSTGLYYVVYPPAPAIVLLPPVAILGRDFHQEYASILMGAFNVAIASWILRGMGATRGFRVVMSLVFGFGTIVWYSATVGTSWHFAHVCATFFMLLAIRACQLDARTGLIGLLFAGAVLSRLPVAMAAPFFVAYLVDRHRREATGDRTVFGELGAETPPVWRSRIDLGRLVELGAPWVAGIAVPVIAYLIYDRLRFGSPFENGYALIPGLLQEEQYKHGFFSVYNIPRQLYAMFLSMPVQVENFPWVKSRPLGGLSIVLTSPIFLWAIKARRPDWFGVGTWASVALILIPVLTHADPGGAQFGYRYGQDIYPFLFLLTVRGLGGRIGFEAWLAIVAGFVVNAWGMATAYYDSWYR